MKVTVKENKVDEIDFSVKGQILDCNGIIVITTGEHYNNVFEAYLIDIDDKRRLDLFKVTSGWSKSVFKKFNGTITIEQ